jgi:polyisoprenyl-phosphate glycosyltransferase
MARNVSSIDPAAGGDPDVCVVVPAYNEEENLEDFHREVSAALDPLDISYAFLFVDDGSTDRTAEILTDLRRRDERVCVIRLARNFGLQAALAAGMQHAPGRAIVIMDADLQDDPAALGRLVERWQGGAQVVYAIRSKRKESVIKRILFSGFHRLMSSLAEIPIPRDAGSFALYDRVVVDHVNALPERNRYLPGLRAWVGFRQVGVPVARRARNAGEPAQSIRRLVALALDGIFAFSKAPLRFASLLGFFVTVIALVALLVIVYWRFVERSFPTGVGLATIALSLLFLGGVQLLMMGIIGEYVGRVYDEVKRRPHFIVAESMGIAVAEQVPEGGATDTERVPQRVPAP